MDSSNAARPRVRATTVTATLTLAAGAARAVVIALAPDADAVDAALFTAMFAAGLVCLIGVVCEKIANLSSRATIAQAATAEQVAAIARQLADGMVSAIAGRREVLRALGQLRVDDRDRDVLGSALMAELRRMAPANREQTEQITQICERLKALCRSADYAAGFLDCHGGLPPSADQLRGLRSEWKPPGLPPNAGN